MTTNWATWLASTNPNVQPLRRITVRSAASWRSQCQRSRPSPAVRRLGTSATHWSTTPSEVPSPSSTNWACDRPRRPRVGLRPAKRPNQISTAMQTRLLTMGAQATATKRRWVLSSAVASAKNAVGGDLDDEPAQQRGGVGALERQPCGGAAVCDVVSSAVRPVMKTGRQAPGRPRWRPRERPGTPRCTAEMEVKASSLVRLDSWSTKTGMKVAESTPPSTMS